mgnify:CR=1 FL=1
MQVSLSHAEVQAAVVALLAKRGVLVDGQDIAVSFSMGRKNSSLMATVVIEDPEVKTLPAAVTQEAIPEEVAAPAASVTLSSEEAPKADQEPASNPEPDPEPGTEASVADSPFQAPASETPKSLFGS